MHGGREVREGGEVHGGPEVREGGEVHGGREVREGGEVHGGREVREGGEVHGGPEVREGGEVHGGRPVSGAPGRDDVAGGGGAAAPRILIVNPNSTEAVTRGIDAAVAPFRFADGPRIECTTLTEGPPGIETQEQADSVVAPLCALVRREASRTAAFVVACFGDPGLHAARDATSRPVFGIARCAYLHALAMGERFGVIAIVEASVARHRRYVRQMGLEAHFGASVPIGVGVTDLAGDGVVQRMSAVGERLRDEHGCDVVILGCAGMAQYRGRIEAALGVPVVDPCQAAAARALAALRIDGAG